VSVEVPADRCWLEGRRILAIEMMGFIASVVDSRITKGPKVELKRHAAEEYFGTAGSCNQCSLDHEGVAVEKAATVHLSALCERNIRLGLQCDQNLEAIAEWLCSTLPFLFFSFLF